MNKSLIKLNPGENGIVQEIAAGGTATKRLYEMGFNSGAKVKIMKNDLGPVVVSLSGNKVAVGRGLAEKIIVHIQ